MAGILDMVRRTFAPARPAQASASPFQEIGVGGSAIMGGYVGNDARNPAMRGGNRWRTSKDIMTNISIVAAGLRYTLNLTARPQWKVEPPNDTAPARQAAEFVESILHSTDSSWSRVVRRSAMYPYHGFGLHEWVAKKRDDGKIGIASIRRRPVHTISRWDVDPHGDVLGVWQSAPGSGQEIYLPRQKLVYLVDDALDDSPEGFGWIQQLAKPAEHMRKLIELEIIGFERDLAGTPIGRAPYAAIKQAVAAAQITEAQGKELVAGIEDFVRNKSKQPDTGLILDSQPFISKASDGTQQVSAAMQYGIELLKGDPGSMEELGAAIDRVTWDMALIMGTERLLVGREGAGSLSLSQDTSHNLALNINSVLGDMAETYDRDIIGPVWALNGMPDELRPTLKVEDASFKDVEKIARVLADMASAGAMLAPDDPAIEDIRDLAGISRPPEMTPDRLEMMLTGSGDPGAPQAKPGDDPDNPDDPALESQK